MRRQPVKFHEITAISHTGRRQREVAALTDATRRRCQWPRRRTCSRALLPIKEACCAIVWWICTRCSNIHTPCSRFLGKMVFHTRPKGHSSFFIYSSLPHFLFLPHCLDLLALFFSLFPSFLKDTFNVSEVVGFLANWLKFAAQRFSQNTELHLHGGRGIVLTISRGGDLSSKRGCLLLCCVGLIAHVSCLRLNRAEM